MNTYSETQLLEQLNWRYAVKKFDASKKIPSSTWKTLEQTLVLTPSSYGLQPWKFLVVQNPELRSQLRPVSWNQSQIEDCSHLVVMTIKTEISEAYVKKFIQRISDVRKTPIEKLADYQAMMVGDVVQGPRSKMIETWASRQAYIALGNLMTSAALLGIDACPMEGFEPARYDEILKLNGTGYKSVVVCPLGYRHPDDHYAQAAKVRFDVSEMITTLN